MPDPQLPTSSTGTPSPLTALPPGWTASRSLAASILLWFELLALAIGAAQFAVVPETIAHSTVALGALVVLLVIAIGVRVTPYFRKHPVQRCIWDTFALLAMAV